MLERVGSQVLLVAMWISNVAARAFVMSDILEPSVFCEWKNRPHHCFYHIACKTRETEQCAEVLPLPVHVAELIVDLHNHCRDHAISKRPHDPPEFFITYPRLGHLPPSAGLMQLVMTISSAPEATIASSVVSAVTNLEVTVGVLTVAHFRRQNLAVQLD